MLRFSELPFAFAFWLADRLSRLTDRSSWLTDRSPRPADCSFRSADRSTRLPDRPSRLIDRSSRLIIRSSWLIVRSPRLIDRSSGSVRRSLMALVPPAPGDDADDVKPSRWRAPGDAPGATTSRATSRPAVSQCCVWRMERCRSAVTAPWRAASWATLSASCQAASNTV